MAVTFADALKKVGVTVPTHLVADAEVPVLTGVQAQGDVLIVPSPAYGEDDGAVVPDGGVQVVVGESSGNTHWLHRGFDSPGVTWRRIDSGLRLGVVTVPEGQTAELIHTDEHGCNAMGPGTYILHGKREQADQMRRVAD